MELRSKKWQDPQDDDTHKNKKKYHIKEKNCPDQIFCENLLLLNGACKNKHLERDKKLAQEWSRIRKSRKALIIFQSAKQNNQQIPVLLFGPKDLPLEILMETKQIEKRQNEKKKGENNEESSAKDDKTTPKGNLYKNCCYYEAEYKGVNRQTKRIILTGLKEIAKFGELKVEIDLQEDNNEPYYEFQFPTINEKIIEGTVTLNWENKKVLKDNSGTYKPYYFLKNEEKQYPLLDGCVIRSSPYLEKKVPKIFSIKYNKFKFSGKLTLDKNGCYYVKCRNSKHEAIDISSLPENLIQKIKGIQKTLPYSILNLQTYRRELVDQINDQLDKYLFQGDFYSWPRHFLHPLGQIQEQFSLLSLKSLKNAVIYQYMINQIHPTEKERKKSSELCSSIEKLTFKNSKILQDYIFTIDGAGTRCHDDALSIKLTKSGDESWFEVGVHISDVDQHVPLGSDLDEFVYKRDKTVYVKGFYSPMFCPPLIKHLSLSKGVPKYAFSLGLRVNQKGLIDFKSINFKTTTIKVDQNYFHSKRLEAIEELKDFFSLIRVIQSSGVLDEKYLLRDEQDESQRGIESLMLISSMIPTFMVKNNVLRIQKSKKNVYEFINQTVESIKLLMKEWEGKMKKIKQSEKQMTLIESERKKIIRKIQVLATQKMKAITKQIKQKNKKQKQEKKTKKRQVQGKGDEDSESDSNQDDLTNLSETKTVASVQQLKQMQKEIDEQNKRQLKVNSMLAKNVKIGKKNAEKQEEVSESSSSEEDLSSQNDQKKLARARGSMNYMNKVFEAMDIKINWRGPKQIDQMFKEASEFDQSELLQIFLKRMKIMNRQHFRYIEKLMKQQYNSEKKQISKEPSIKQKKVQQNPNKIQQNKPKQKFIQINEVLPYIKIDINDLIQLEQKPTNKKIKQITFPKGKKLAKNNRHLAWRFFSSRTEELLNQGIIKIDPIEDGNKVSQENRTLYLKGIILGVLVGFEFMVGDKNKSELEKEAKKRALQFYEKSDKQLEQKFIVSQAQKTFGDMNKTEDMQKMFSNGKFLKQLKLLTSSKNEIKKEQSKIQKNQAQEENKEGLQKEKKEQEIDIEQQSKNRKVSKDRISEETVKLIQNIFFEGAAREEREFFQRVIIGSSKISVNENSNEKPKVNSENETGIGQNQNQFEQNITKEDQKQSENKSEKPNKMASTEKTKMQEVCKKYLQKKDFTQIFTFMEFLKQSRNKEEFVCEEELLQIDQGKNEFYKEFKIRQIRSAFYQKLNKQRHSYLQQAATKNGKKCKKLKKPENNWKTNGQILEAKINKMKQLFVADLPNFLNEIQVYFYLQQKQKPIFESFLKPCFSYIKTDRNNEKQGTRKQKGDDQNQKKRTRTRNYQQQKKEKDQQNEKSNKLGSKLDSSKQESIKGQTKTVQNEQKMEKIENEKTENISVEGSHQQQQSVGKDPIQSDLKQKNEEANESKQSDQDSASKVEVFDSELKQKKEQKGLSKKMARKLLEEKKKEVILQISKDFEQQMSCLKQKIGCKNEIIKNEKLEFKKSLESIDKEFNILDYIAQKIEKIKQKSKQNKKTTKKGKKKTKEVQKKQEGSEDENEELEYVCKICEIVQEYAKKCGHKFTCLNLKQIEQYLKQKVQIHQIGNNEELNRQFKQISNDEQTLLKWNNPIRSYSALETIRLLKQFDWVFNSEISPLDILTNYRDLKLVKSRMKSIEKFKEEKMANGQDDKRQKQANREIEKIEFYYRIKNQINKEHIVLNVTSPNQRNAKRVYHPILGEITVNNSRFQQQLFREVKAKFKIISHFPIEIEAFLSK